MDEYNPNNFPFDDKDKENAKEVKSTPVENQQDHPDYYNAGENFGTYNKPKDEPQNNNQNYYTPGGQSQNYYTPPTQNNHTYQSSNMNSNNNFGNNGNSFNQNPMPQGPKPPKKNGTSKAVVTIIIVLVVCLAIAGVGLVTFGAIDLNNSKSSQTTTSQSEKGSASVKDSDKTQTKDSNGDYTVAGVAKEGMDSCVGITVYAKQDDYSYFFGYGSSQNNGNTNDKGETATGEGSGVIMSEENGKTYIITCAHVISDGTSFKVTLNDDTTLDATMVGFDSQTDIGVLSVDKTGLQVAEFGNSDQLEIGAPCVAIGCPGGLEFKNSVTSGIVSALARPVSSQIGYNNKCIQTDTAINPGNSGGALFNMQGQVIGINSSKIASTEYEGMGFSVPSNTAINTANSLIKNGYVSGRAKLGVKYNALSNFNNSDSILNALAQKGFKNAQGTMVIQEIDSTSSLASEDVKQYDMIVAVNGKTMTSIDVLTSILSESKPGDTVKLTIARIENNTVKTFNVNCKLIENKE